MTALPRQLSMLFLAFGLLLPQALLATNGYFLIGAGSKSTGMGGVGIALPQQGQAAIVNPAGIVDLGTRVDADLALFLPKRTAACCVAPEGAKSGSNIFLIPSAGATYKFNRKISLGFGTLGSGANTRYNKNFFFDDPTQPGGQADTSEGSLGVNLIQLIMAPAIAYNINKQQSVGVALQIGVQTFRAYGLQEAFRPFSSNPEYLTNNGNDWSYGAGVRVGWLGKFFNNKINLGATYASRTYMTNFDKYKGLFAEQGDFDIPENYGFGIAYKPTDKLTLAFDYVRINYKDIKSVGNPSLPISSDPANTADKLGATNGPGFWWNNQNVYKFGIAYDWNDRWTFRAGYNYAKTPIQDNASLEFNTLAPAVTEKHYTIGGTYNLSKKAEINFDYRHSPKNKMDTTIDGSTQLPYSGKVEIDMFINVYEVGFSYKFF